MSTLSAFMQQAIVVPVSDLPKFTKRHSALGNASILAAVCPRLAMNQVSTAKPLHYLSPADKFMLQETTELLARLQQTSLQLGIEDEFSLSLQGEKLVSNNNIEQHQNLANALQQDKGFIDKFSWLRPNYLALANSLEWLNFADVYEVSRAQANQRFAHLQQKNHGLQCYLRKQGKHVDFVLESPINLFKVSVK